MCSSDLKGFRFVMFDDGSPDDGNLHVYNCQRVDDSVTHIAEPAGIFQLAPVDHAITVLRHLDDVPRYNDIYAELKRWARDNGWTPLGPGRDVTIDVGTDGQPVMETQWPVVRTGDTSSRPQLLPVAV